MAPRSTSTRLPFPAFARAAGVACALALPLPALAARAQQPPAVGGPAPRDTIAARLAPLDTLLDLGTVVARALRVSPAAAVATAGVRAARSEVRVASGQFLPSLTASSTLLRSDVTGATPGTGAGGAASYSAGLASSVELFTGGRRGADRDRADADLQAADASDVAQRYAVTLLAQRGYYEALRGTELITVASSRVSRAERGVRFASDRVRAGIATRSDELRARLELAAGRQQLNAARDTLLSASYALGRLVGADGPVGALPPTSLDVRRLALGDSEIVHLAVAEAPAVRVADAQARATAAARRAARAQYAPGVRLTGGYNVANQSPVLGGARPGWQLAVGTSYPLFNGFQREDAIVRADAAADVARAIALDTRRLVRAESARLLGALRLAEDNITLSGDAVEAAQEDLRVQTQRYRAGISTALDQLTSQLAVTQAELGLVAARYNYQLLRAALEALVGRAP